jgi:hypothetical protein
MKSGEVYGILKQVPRHYAVVKITKDRRLYGGMVKKGSYGYLSGDGMPPTVYMITGEYDGCLVSMPVGNMKFLGYYDQRGIYLIKQDARCN